MIKVVRIKYLHLHDFQTANTLYELYAEICKLRTSYIKQLYNLPQKKVTICLHFNDKTRVCRMIRLRAMKLIIEHTIHSTQPYWRTKASMIRFKHVFEVWDFNKTEPKGIWKEFPKQYTFLMNEFTKHSITVQC